MSTRVLRRPVRVLPPLRPPVRYRPWRLGAGDRFTRSQQCPTCVRRAAPVTYPVDREPKALFAWTGNGVVETHALDEPAVAAIARVGDDHIEERTLLARRPGLI